MEKLSSSQLKWIKSLHQQKFRRQEQKFIIEGEKMVEEALKEKPQSIEMIVGKSDWWDKNKINYQGFLASEKEMERISTMSTPPSVLAVLKFLPLTALKKAPITLVLDGIRDPGNLGTIIRTADWYGIQQIVCSEDTVELYNSKTLQATMGSFLRVELHYEDIKYFLEEQNNPIIGTILNEDAIDLKQLNIESELILVMGSESHGIRPEILPLITHPTFIKGKGKAESLNVGIATGICLSHLTK